MNKKQKFFLISNTAKFFNAFMLNHINELNKKYNVFILCLDAKTLKKKVPKNVSLLNLKFKRNIDLLSDVIVFFEMLYLFLKIKPKISLSFTPKIGLMVSIVSFITRTSKRIHWFTGQFWIHKKGFIKFFCKLADKLIFFLNHKVLIDSHSQKNFLIKENIISNKNSFVLHKGSVGGVDVKKFKSNKKIRLDLRKKYSISKKTFIFLYLGRIKKEKGILELIEAYNQIKKNHKILLVIVGPIEEKNLISQIKQSKKILYFNYTDNPEIFFSLADILCLPSYREGFGTVVIEAASCGIPTICSNIFGLRDTLIEYKTGLLHKVKSVRDLKKKMLFVINNKKLVKKYGKSAKLNAHKNFNQTLITKKLVNFLTLNVK